MENKFFSRGLKLATLVALLTTTGCAEYHRRVLEHTEVRGCKFTATLAKEYEELGKIEQDVMYDEASADYYYQKAIRAREGCLVAPTTLEKWDIECDKIAELSKAREHLIRALQSGAREVAPEMTARAQAHFDCWVEQQSEGWQQNDIGECRKVFYESMKVVEKKLRMGPY